LRTRSAGKEYLEDITAQANVKGRALGATTISAAPPDQTALRDLKPTSLENPREVFLVHGHDEATREKVARFLERLHLEPIILHEQPNRGRTVIEKFEDHSKVCYAIVLLTPDDVGGPWKSNDRLPRARQNVILEHGYFVGLLGRRHVCALTAEGESP
jgi:predicted nucleotide-binding protein